MKENNSSAGSRNNLVAPAVFEKRQKVSEAKDRQKKSLIIGSVITLALVLVIGGLFWYKSSTAARIEQIKNDTDPNWREKAQKREQFAAGLNRSIDQKSAQLTAPVFSTSGDDHKILVVTADNISDQKCQALAADQVLQTAQKEIGFLSLQCINRNSGETFTRALK